MAQRAEHAVALRRAGDVATHFEEESTKAAAATEALCAEAVATGDLIERLLAQHTAIEARAAADIAAALATQETAHGVARDRDFVTMQARHAAAVAAAAHAATRAAEDKATIAKLDGVAWCGPVVRKGKIFKRFTPCFMWINRRGDVFHSANGSPGELIFMYRYISCESR